MNPWRGRVGMVLALALAAPAAATASTACPAALQHTMPRLQDERPVDRCRYAGQVVLVGRDGQVIRSHPSATSPDDPAFVRDLERLIEAK